MKPRATHKKSHGVNAAWNRFVSFSSAGSLSDTEAVIDHRSCRMRIGRVMCKVAMLVVASLSVLAWQPALGAVTPPPMSSYTAVPPFINNSVPPLVMLLFSKDHRMFLKAYNDITDLDGDGVVDTTYKDNIQYDGYFDWTKCYTYNTSASPSARFEPVGAAAGANGHYCTSNWSGNFLNWATMARIDVMRKVLYGGHRSIDTTSTTVLSRTLLPQDGHSWAKAYNGADLSSLTPFSWTSITFCNTNDLSTETSGQVMVVNGLYPYAASTENKQCLWQQNTSSSSPYGPALTVYKQYNADVLACVPSMLETNCQTYTDTSNGVHYKPTGLMQQMGVDRRGTATTTDDVIFMKFALISGSYGAHVSGGVLRSNISDVNSEVDPATGMIASTSKIIKSIDAFQIVQYSWGNSWYEGTVSATSPQTNNNCHMGEVLDLSTSNNGICRSWGNPIGEMFYEALRYFMGMSGPTPEYQVSSPDSGLLGLTVDSSWVDPYSPTGGNCPYCSKPFILMLTDPRPSYDSDQLPGSYWYKSISTSDVPSVQTLISNANINSLEGIGSVYIGQSGSTNDRACTPKAGNFGNMRGLCIEEPTKQGSFYLAGLANYAKTTDLRSSVTGSQTVTTYSVVTDPPFPALTFTVGGQQVQIIPAFHDGCPITGWGNICSSGPGTNGDNSGGEIVDFKLCPTDPDWTTEQGNGFTSCYDILWDDADYGWDYELDVRYRIYVKTASGSITVKTRPLYASAGHTDYAGYFINGVVGGGQYLDMACGGKAGPPYPTPPATTPPGGIDCDLYTNVIYDNVVNLSDAVNTRTFTVSGSTAQVLNDPLWYAAKYGGFNDKNGNNVPDLPSEWDANSDGVPDTYFYTANPLQLQAQLGSAFVSILAKAASGTAVSVLANSSSGSGALYQAYFLPTTFDVTTLNEVRWLGYLQSLFIDEFGNLREDTDQNGRLTYQNDYIVTTSYDNSSTSSPTYGQVIVNKYIDADGDGKADSTTPTISNQPLSSLLPAWEAGKQLALRNLSSTPRKIFTWIDPTNVGIVDPGEQIAFSVANDTKIAPYLNSGTAPFTTDNIINFILGTQVTGLRNRQLTVGGSLQTWKLGDIINSTPTLVGAPHERFDVIYGDATYQAFFQQYRNRRQVLYAGANDGMLHAFNGGFYNVGDDPTTTTITEHGWFSTQETTPPFVTNTAPLGQELWGFIPQQLLPHLRWLADPNYSHVYYVDLKPKATDVRIFCDSGSSAPPTCINGQTTSHPNGWGTVLIVGFRLGGSCGGCSGTQAPPMTINADFNYDGSTTGATDTRTFYSAYMVLDVTDPETDPKLLWVFSDSTLGLTTGYPTVIRMNPTTALSKTDGTNAKWYVLFGSGPTDYNGGISQTSTLFAIDLIAGPGINNAQKNPFPVSTLNSWIGDLQSVDKDLDFRTDVAYMGTTINIGSPPWRGKLYRLTMNGCSSPPCNTGSWGILSSGNRVPTEILDTFPSSGSITTGPITVGVTITSDDNNRIWVFFGTGRYWSTADKTNTETQYFIGIKDSVASGTCTESTVTNCWNNNLLNVSAATVCTVCTGTQVTGVPGVSTVMGTTTTTLQGLIQTMDGWYTTLPTLGERVVVPATLLGGTVFFTSFVPATDICTSAGNSNLYALFYQTGSGTTSATVGTSSGNGGNTNVNKSVSIGSNTGLGSQMAVEIGRQGSGNAGGAGNGNGCQSGVTGIIQSSTGTLSSVCTNVTGIYSRYISWINQRL